MRLTKILSAANWKYAIAETTLIVVGITIALAANSWYEGRQERREELLLIRQLHQTLTTDSGQLSERIEAIQRDEQDIEALLEHLESGKPYDDGLRRYFVSLSRFGSTSIQSAPFEALKARGLGLVSSESLRLKLISLYQDTVPGLIATDQSNINFSQQMVMPYLMSNFRQAGQEEGFGWAPLDYEEIASDSYLINLGRQRLVSIRRFQLQYYERTLSSIREILVEIEGELDE